MARTRWDDTPTSSLPPAVRAVHFGRAAGSVGRIPRRKPMADDTEYPKRGYDTKDVEAMREERPAKRRRHWGKIALLSITVVPAVLLALWAWITLSYTYSEGDR